MKIEAVHTNAPTRRSWFEMRIQCLFGVHYFVDYYEKYYLDKCYLYTKCKICGKQGKKDENPRRVI